MVPISEADVDVAAAAAEVVDVDEVDVDEVVVMAEVKDVGSRTEWTAREAPGCVTRWATGADGSAPFPVMVARMACISGERAMGGPREDMSKEDQA